MATVFLARDLKHDRPVALKVLHPELSAVLGPDRFLREVKVTAQLQHPHILPLFDSGKAGDLVFYVMPFIEGESLRALLEREKQLPVDQAVRIATQVAAALDYAHRRGVVHRDIKPENILLHGGTALVADFGIALAAGNDRLTETGLAVGTPEYMSPEQATADRNADGRSDIYSLGCVLYEMLAGEPPHTGRTAQAIIARTVVEEPRRLRTVRPSVPTHVDAAVHKALAKLPADRFATAAAFAEALATDDGAAPATATSGAERWQKNHPTVDKTFQLTIEVCRKLDRKTLDPRVIGDRIHYLDNDATSDVLILYMHGLGLDQSSFDDILRVMPYRGLAPTLYGFEPGDRRPIQLTLSDHVKIMREFCRDAIARVRPKRTLLVGFSHGGDLGFEILTAPAREPPLAIDGFLSLGCNLDLGTCFVSTVLANLAADDTGRVVAELRSLGSDLQALRDWMSLHDYLVRVFRKFEGDLAPLRALAREIVAPFSTPQPPFPRWYRNAMASVACLRCVFSNSAADSHATQQIKLQHLDQGILGPDYREGTIVTEAEWNHFDLVNPALHRRHIEEMLGALQHT
jgi:serine/threonine protein kinase